MKRSIVIGLVFLAVLLGAAEKEPQKIEEARRIVAEYETSERARVAAALIKARELVDRQEPGAQQATEEQLQAARDLILKDKERQATERQSAIDAVPVFMVLRLGSTVELGKLLDAANREFVKSRVAEIKSRISGDEEGGAERTRKELQAWEKALADFKPTGKVLGGLAATIFEEQDSFVVAYFENSRMEHFVCRLRKESLTPILEPKLSAFNATQKELIILD